MTPVVAILAGLTLGLTSGGYCFWSCASVMGPFMVCTSPQRWGHRWSTVPGALRALAWYNLGRLVAYLAAGLLVTGLTLSGAAEFPLLLATTRLVTGVILALLLLRKPRAEGCLSSRQRSTGALAMGLLQGLTPCPPFLAALTLALSLPGLSTGLLLFLSLFAGTALLTLPLAFIEPLRHRPWLTHLSRAVGLLVCLYLVISALHIALTIP